MAVRPEDSLKAFACRSPFWPVVASSTKSTSGWASGMRLPMVRRILVSSSMRLALVCKRPAVSMMTTSMPRALAASMASKTTADGSAPAAWETTGTSMRSAHSMICSMAAARNVSAAASKTLAPSDLKRYASLAMVVVLPVPLTPTTRMTAGMPGPGMRGQGTALRSANRPRSSSWRAFWGPTSMRARARSQTSMASSAPRSAEMSASSTSSHVSSSGSPELSRPLTRSAKPMRVDCRASCSKMRSGGVPSSGRAPPSIVMRGPAGRGAGHPRAGRPASAR